MLASALDKAVTFAGEVLRERKFQTATKQETPCKQIDLRIPGRPVITNTEDEKVEKHFSFSAWQSKS